MVETTVGDVVVGLETPLALVVFPAAVVALLALTYWRTEGAASSRSRRLLTLSRAVVVLLVVVAVAGPYTVSTRETPGDPRVTLLTDSSDSMAVVGGASGLADDIEAQGVPTRVAAVGNGTRSRVGDGVVANLRENGSVVVVSDGQVTDGTSLATAAETARGLNATISAVRLQPRTTERYVRIDGPAKTSAGVPAAFLVTVGGVQTNGSVDLSVTVDGEEIATHTFERGRGSFEVRHTFNETGPHRVVAEIDSPDRFERNDVFRSTVRVVERPRVLYVAPPAGAAPLGEYPLRGYLTQLYNVTVRASVPDDLSGYYAVVVQNAPADQVGNVSALQEFVIDGGGLVTVGGPRAFERGGYDGSSFGSMQPVRPGDSGPGTSRIVLAIDVSGSAQEGMRVQKAIALNVLKQLGENNEVGVVAFNYRAYRVASLQPLSENRETVADRIRRLQAGGATDIGAGLRGAADMLGEERGTVILISDGADNSQAVLAAADRLGSRGVPVIAVGVGQQTNVPRLREIARLSGGSYIRADETRRLRILFGGSSRQFEGSGLTVVNPNTFLTAGVELESNPGNANDVAVKAGADLLVAGPEGEPVLARWRYGLGRVVSLTAYDDQGTLDGLLSRPDSLLVTKTVNYAIGDPERLRTGVADAADTRVGEPTTITYRGERRPTGEGVQFRRVGVDRYEATVVPRQAGFSFVAGAEFAANYPREYGAFGQSDALIQAVESTNGRVFEPGEAAAIARFARESARAVREVRDSWTPLALALALLVFLAEVVVRRVQVYRGRTRRESGLI
ncbi:MAG: VWA domain-containing protein [Haloferacaceae archaeon]